MATDDAEKTSGAEPVESLIDDLIRDIFTEAGQAAKPRTRGESMAALIESAIASAPPTTPTSSVLERFLVSRALATALSDALAPALADALAPEIMKALGHYPTGETPGGETPSEPTPPPRGGRRKP